MVPDVFVTSSGVSLIMYLAYNGKKDWSNWLCATNGLAILIDGFPHVPKGECYPSFDATSRI